MTTEAIHSLHARGQTELSDAELDVASGGVISMLDIITHAIAEAHQSAMKLIDQVGRG